jgi:hypothetical protein
MTCSHLEHVHVTELPEAVEGCEDCLAQGTKWFHLRICLECGRVAPRRRRRAPDHALARAW